MVAFGSMADESQDVSKPDIEPVKQALLGARVEIYRSTDEEIQIAERVRFHIMDSGVRVQLTGKPRVLFTARSQRSDFPNADPTDLFSRVRSHVGHQATKRGYFESGARSVDVNDPVDETRILDVWHEVTYAKDATSIDEVVEEVQWALSVEKYVAGSPDNKV